MLSLNWKTMNDTVYVYRTHAIRFAFSAVLLLLHLAYALCSWLADRTAFARASVDPWLLDDERGRRRRNGRLAKKPGHLVVSVCQERVHCERLANVLAWALYLDVPVVSFYHNEDGKRSRDTATPPPPHRVSRHVIIRLCARFRYISGRAVLRVQRPVRRSVDENRLGIGVRRQHQIRIQKMYQRWVNGVSLLFLNFARG